MYVRFGSRKLWLLVLLISVGIGAVTMLSSCGYGGRSSQSHSADNSPLHASSRHTDEQEASLRQSDDDSHPDSEAPKQQDASRHAEPSLRSHPPTHGNSTGMPGNELVRGQSGCHRIALTFDAGASSKPTPDLLKTLAAYGVKSTFFLTGKWVEQNPDLARQIVAEGHEVGNHTYSHPDLRDISDEDIRDQLVRAEDIIMSTTGGSSKPYFRPPFGGRDSRVIQVAENEGYKCVYWSVDSWDGYLKGIKAQQIEDRVLQRSEDGSIVLMHCGSWPTVEALPKIIKQLKEQGYELVKVSEL